MNRLCSTQRASWNAYKVLNEGRQGSLLLWSPNCEWWDNSLLICTSELPVPVTAPSRVWVCSRLFTGIGLSNSAGGHGCLSLGSDGCCQVKVSAKGRSLLQRISTECDLETSTMRRSRFNRVVLEWKKLKKKLDVWIWTVFKQRKRAVIVLIVLQIVVLWNTRMAPCILLKREAAYVSRSLTSMLMIDKEWNPRMFGSPSTHLRETQISE